MSVENGMRRGLNAFVLAAVVMVSACDMLDTLLEVDNPARINEEQLADPTLITILMNSALSDFQVMLDGQTYHGAIISDEAVTGHNFFQWRDIDLRIFKREDTVLDNSYVLIHNARFVADTAASLIRALVPDADQDLRLARTLAFGGYSYLFLGEFYCETPFNVSAERYDSDQVVQIAIDRFEDAIQVAQAAKVAGASAAAADSIINLALVGVGRGHLWLGDNQQAAAAATQVPADFGWDVKYSDNSNRERLGWRTATTGANHNIGVDASFRDLDDPRVRHMPEGRTGHNQLTILFTPFKPSSYSGWSIEQPAGWEPDDAIRLASGLEARYIVAEATGPTAETLALVNERRAVGSQDPTSAAGDALMAELRDQRRRDFYLDGHRFGDLRRYLKHGVGDFFPTGAHPNAEWGNYDVGTCLPVPLLELISNPSFD